MGEKERHANPKSSSATLTNPHFNAHPHQCLSSFNAVLRGDHSPKSTRTGQTFADCFPDVVQHRIGQRIHHDLLLLTQISPKLEMR